MSTYLFHVTLLGRGKNIDEAWLDATDAFAADPGPWDRATSEETETETEPTEED